VKKRRFKTDILVITAINIRRVIIILGKKALDRENKRETEKENKRQRKVHTVINISVRTMRM
jgi:hypothetical protein